MPDGTRVQGQSSQLFSKLDSQLGAGHWETAILDAFQTWAENSNINVGQVADGGQPEGIAGPAQGDARFGDIRISAIPLPADVAAITSPYDPGTGTISGDMILNSNDDFSSASGYDLFTVALHEAGHVFGFADSSDPTSFMYDVYTGPQTGLELGRRRGRAGPLRWAPRHRRRRRGPGQHERVEAGRPHLDVHQLQRDAAGRRRPRRDPDRELLTSSWPRPPR